MGVPNTTQNRDTGASPLETRCPGCGREQAAWTAHGGLGYAIDRETYCCAGCAKEDACLCMGPTTLRRRRYPIARIEEEGEQEYIPFPKPSKVIHKFKK